MDAGESAETWFQRDHLVPLGPKHLKSTELDSHSVITLVLVTVMPSKMAAGTATLCLSQLRSLRFQARAWPSELPADARDFSRAPPLMKPWGFGNLFWPLFSYHTSCLF